MTRYIWFTETLNSWLGEAEGIHADILAVEPAELDGRKVTFKQIPRDVKVY